MQYTQRNILIGILVLAAVVLVFYALSRSSLYQREDMDTQDRVATTSTQGELREYRNDDIGLSFRYRTGDGGYVLEEPALDATNPALVKVIVLMTTAEAAEMQRNQTAREFPPTITVQVIENTQNQRPRAWADTHTAQSNIGLVTGDIDPEFVVGGAPAIRYMVDGLYRTDTVVVTHGSFVYLISGSFLDNDSQIRKDFMPFLESIVFIPRPGEVKGDMKG